ncbi:isocitrate lyase/PEP mutase family protein [Micromonospora sp. DT227]|uniref:isocitrate lyase/PEP mutase family protein n=1 Tax=Micromonospora sp. DT227 TaxID=3393433 RepID=UPI003CF33D99
MPVHAPVGFADVLAAEPPVYAAGVWDGLSATLAAAAGFRCLFVSGFAVAASLGLPDADLYTRADMTRAVGVAARAGGLPVIADLDTGWGNAVNAYHAARDFERAGAAALMLEDQISPKPGPLSEQAGVSLVPRAEAAAKVRACVDARDRAAVVARTNADTVDEVLRRAEAYAAAGADVVFPMRHDETFPFEAWQATRDACGRPLAAAVAPGSWLERELTPAIARELGIAVVIYGLQGLLATARALTAAYTDLLGPEPGVVAARGVPLREFTRLIGYDEVTRLRDRYLGAGGVPPRPGSADAGRGDT